MPPPWKKAKALKKIRSKPRTGGKRGRNGSDNRIATEVHEKDSVEHIVEIAQTVIKFFYRFLTEFINKDYRKTLR